MGKVEQIEASVNQVAKDFIEEWLSPVDRRKLNLSVHHEDVAEHPVGPPKDV